MGREGDDGRIRRSCSSRFRIDAECLEAIHLGHLNIHEHQVEPVFAAGFHGLPTVIHHCDLMPSLLEHDRDDLLIDRVVLGEEDPQAARGRTGVSRGGTASRSRGMRRNGLPPRAWAPSPKGEPPEFRLANRLGEDRRDLDVRCGKSGQRSPPEVRTISGTFVNCGCCWTRRASSIPSIPGIMRSNSTAAKRRPSTALLAQGIQGFRAAGDQCRQPSTRT